MNDDILEDIRNGSRDAFKQFYDTYENYAIRTAKAITRNDEHAKDAVQEAFIRVYRNIYIFLQLHSSVRCMVLSYFS